MTIGKAVALLTTHLPKVHVAQCGNHDDHFHLRARQQPVDLVRFQLVQEACKQAQSDIVLLNAQLPK